MIIIVVQTNFLFVIILTKKNLSECTASLSLSFFKLHTKGIRGVPQEFISIFSCFLFFSSFVYFFCPPVFNSYMVHAQVDMCKVAFSLLFLLQITHKTSSWLHI